MFDRQWFEQEEFRVNFKGSLWFLLRLYLFWLFTFNLSRFAFLVYHSPKLQDVGLDEILLTFTHAFSLDLSAAAYLTLLSTVLVCLSFAFAEKTPPRLAKVINVLLVFISVLLAAGDAVLYDEWMVKLNFKALQHLVNPEEVIRTASRWYIFIYCSISLLLFVPLYRIYIVWVHTKVPFRTQWYKSVVLLIVSVPLLALAMRGGTSPIPINESSAYFSKHNILNDAAINTCWATIHSLTEYTINNKTQHYAFYEQSLAEKTVSDLYHPIADSSTADTLDSLLTVHRPNIVLLILESWTADVSHTLGGPKGIAPTFDSLAAHGLLFSSFYASGYTSDQGIPAIYSGYPAIPRGSISTQPSKYPRLPSLNRALEKEEYNSSFYFGGQLRYGNLKAYLTAMDIQTIQEQEDLPDDLPSGKLGIHDQDMMAYFARELNDLPTPFFTSLFTLSSHSPYDHPGERSLDIGGRHKPFVNGVHYTDQALAKFFEYAKQQSWYDNTLFIITADHSHASTLPHDVDAPIRSRIPLLLYGNVLKQEQRGRQIDKVASQVDIPAIVLAQLGLEHGKFPWSKNTLRSGTKDFAYYCFYSGIGWVHGEEYFSYVTDPKIFRLGVFTSDRSAKLVKTEGLSYLQLLYQDFVK